MRPKRLALSRDTRDALKAREKRKRETAEERQLRLQNHRQRQYARRQAETVEQRQARLEEQKQRARHYRALLKVDIRYTFLKHHTPIEEI